MERTERLEREALARRAAARHIAAYLLDPSAARADPTLATGTASGGEPDSGAVEECLAREEAAVRALAAVLLERGTLASAEADLIVDVARGDATADDLRDYRVLTRQSRCGLG